MQLSKIIVFTLSSFVCASGASAPVIKMEVSNGQSHKLEVCKPVVATASITVLQVSMFTSQVSGTSETARTGSQEEWEEEYDDWEEEYDVGQSNLPQTKSFATDPIEMPKDKTPSSLYEVEHNEHVSGIRLNLQLRKGEKPYNAAKGFVELYSLKRNIIPKLISMLQHNWNGRKHQQNSSKDDNCGIVAHVVIHSGIPATKSLKNTPTNGSSSLIKLNLYKDESIVMAVRRYASRLYELTTFNSVGLKELIRLYPDPMEVLRNFEQYVVPSSTLAMNPLTFVLTQNDLQLKLPYKNVVSHLSNVLKKVLQQPCRQDQNGKIDQPDPKNHNRNATRQTNNTQWAATRWRRRDLATVLHVRASQSFSSITFDTVANATHASDLQLGNAAVLFLEAAVVDCGGIREIEAWSMFGASLNKWVNWRELNGLEDRDEHGIHFSISFEAAQLGMAPEKLMPLRPCQRMSALAYQKAAELAEAKKKILHQQFISSLDRMNIDTNKDASDTSSYDTVIDAQLFNMRKYIVYVESFALKLRIDWASLIVSTGLDVSTGLQVLQNLCKQQTHVEIPRGTSCYHLGNALYRSLGRIKEGLQAYNAAWKYHENDRTRTLIASRQAASRQNIIAMERSSRIRIQVMTELPHILINRGQAQVANGERKQARLSWREGVKRGWWPHHLQHGSTTLHRGLGARPFWDIETLPSPVKKGIEILRAASAQMATETQKLATNATLWVPSDDLYVRNLAQDQGGSARWRQMFLDGAGPSSPCNNLPLTCRAVKRAIDASNGLMSAAKLSALWCEKCEIIPHCGPTTTRLRLVIPLHQPIGSLYQLLVANKVAPSMVGRPLVFDDSIEHTVRYMTGQENNGDSSTPRMILLMDIVHPMLNDESSVVP